MSFFEMQPRADAEFVLAQIRRNLAARPAAAPEAPAGPMIPSAELARHLSEAQANERSGAPLLHTRFRFLKGVVGKLIRPFTSRQEHFNASVLAASRLLADVAAQLADTLDRTRRDLVAVETQVSQLTRDVAGPDGLDAMRAELERVRRAVTALESVAPLEPRVKGVEDWLRLKAEQIDRLDVSQHTLRMELFFELRSLLRMLGPDETPPRIVNQEKYRRMLAEGHLRLNAGAGHLPGDAYLNVDRRLLPGIDVVADVRDLPFEPETVSEIYAAHVIEHFPVQEAERSLIPHWKRLLSVGGRLIIICPDWEAMLAAYAEGRYSLEDLRLATFGAQEYEGDTHFNMLTPASLTALLERAGFSAVTVKEKGRRNGACFEMEVEAIR